MKTIKKKPTYFILDVDGVLTDGTMIYDSFGKKLKIFGPDDNDSLQVLKKFFNINIDNFFYFKNEFSSTKINTIRKLMSNTKSIDYKIDGDFAICQKNQKILTSNIFINFITFSLVALFKVKRFLGALKRSL